MTKIVGNAEADKIVKGFVELGWIVDQRRDHVVVWNPDDRADRLTVSMGTAPHGYEHLKRMRSRLKRARRAKEERP